jgi:hypothetical protein
MMSSTKSTSATAVANQAAAARVVTKTFEEGIALPGLLGGLSGPGAFGGSPASGLDDDAFASGLAALEILGVFAASPSADVELSDVMAAASDLDSD